MTTWVLILFLSGYGQALTNIPYFESEQSCIDAGELAIKKFSSFGCSEQYVCVKQSRSE